MQVGFGAFGKMPSLGDFFQLNPPAGFVRVWDEWVQSAMMAAQQKGGAAWDDQYMSAPIWRFTLAAGLAGPSKTLGILMPSVDRVGRRFPLSLMARIEGDTTATLDHLDANETFEKLEDLALAALDDGMDRDRLQAGLSEIAVPTAHPQAPLRKAGNLCVMTGAREANVGAELATGLIAAQGISKPSMWTALLDGTSHAMICNGMPEAAQACALFDLSARLWADQTAPLRADTRPT